MPQRPVKLPSSWPVSRIATEYHGGKTLYELSDLIGVSRSTLSRMLKAYGLEVRGRGSYVRRPKGPNVSETAPAAISDGVMALE